MQYALAQIEKLALDLLFSSKSYSSLAIAVTYMNALPEQPSDDEWQQLQDNRDVPIVQKWDGEGFTDSQRQQTFNELVSGYVTWSFCFG